MPQHWSLLPLFEDCLCILYLYVSIVYTLEFYRSVEYQEVANAGVLGTHKRLTVRGEACFRIKMVIMVEFSGLPYFYLLGTLGEMLLIAHR